MALVVVMHSHFQPGDPAAAVIERAGHELQFRHAPLGTIWSPAETVDRLAGAVAVVGGNERYDAEILDALPRLRLICKPGAGYDNVDVAAATERGVAVCTGAGTNAPAVADFTFAMILALARQVIAFDGRVRAGNWVDRPLGCDVEGTTLGIIGTGNIGKAVARRAAGFAMRLLCNDPDQNPAWAAAAGATYVDLPTLLAEADWVTVHCALTPESRNLIGEAELALMKPTAHLVNTARGGVVDADALYRALSDRRIAGAGLDVFASEPPTGADTRLLELDNVLLSPHVAGRNRQAMRLMNEALARNVTAVLAGESPYHCLNPEVLGRPS